MLISLRFSADLCVLCVKREKALIAEDAEIRRERREDYLNWVLHERHSERRRAFRVPHAEQRMYIVRVNQLVMNALTPSIKIKTTAFNRKSFTRCRSPLLWSDALDRVHTRTGKAC